MQLYVTAGTFYLQRDEIYFTRVVQQLLFFMQLRPKCRLTESRQLNNNKLHNVTLSYVKTVLGLTIATNNAK